VTFSQRRVRGSGGDVLVDRGAFAGEWCLAGAEDVRFEEVGVGRDHVARLQEEKVASDHFRCWNHRLAPSAQDPGPRGGQRAQGEHRLFGAVLLEEAHQRIDDQDDPDGHGVGDLTQRGRDDRSREQQPDEGARELRRQDDPRRSGLATLDFVRPVGLELASGFLLGRRGQSWSRRACWMARDRALARAIWPFWPPRVATGSGGSAPTRTPATTPISTSSSARTWRPPTGPAAGPSHSPSPSPSCRGVPRQVCLTGVQSGEIALAMVGGVLAGLHRHEARLGPFAQEGELTFRFQCRHPGCTCQESDACCRPQPHRCWFGGVNEASPAAFTFSGRACGRCTLRPSSGRHSGARACRPWGRPCSREKRAPRRAWRQGPRSRPSAGGAG
jgi:hypothetical protein